MPACERMTAAINFWATCKCKICVSFRQNSAHEALGFSPNSDQLDRFDLPSYQCNIGNPTFFWPSPPSSTDSCYQSLSRNGIGSAVHSTFILMGGLSSRGRKLAAHDYMAELKRSGPQVARIFQAIRGRSGEQKQETRFTKPGDHFFIPPL